MRIIGGRWRSRRIVRPPGRQTRPMPDRAREAIFSMLASRFERPGDLPPLSVADVFAGSGSMGLEALSRGASRCLFYENDSSALSALRNNLSSLQAGDSATICTRDAWRHAMVDSDGGVFDLVILDPPYGDSDDTSEQGEVCQFLAGLTRLENNHPLIVLHHRARVRFTESECQPWSISDTRKFGSSRITIFQR